MKWVALIGLIVLAAAAGFGWKQVGELQRQNARLRSDLATSQANLETVTTTKAAQDENELQKLRADAKELIKLRGEVGLLRGRTNEMAKLLARAQAQQPAPTGAPAAAATQQMPTNPAADQFPRQSWNFAGYGSPEAALVSAIWAMREGKPQAYLDALSPQEQQRMAQAWQDKSEQEIATKHQSDVANVSDLRILSRQTLSPSQVQLQVNLGGVNRSETVVMENVNGQWKFGGFGAPPQQPQQPQPPQ